MSANAPGLPDDDNVFLTAIECAAVLRVSLPTLERWRAKAGSGPRFHKGPGRRSKVTYRVGDVRDWLKRQCRV